MRLEKNEIGFCKIEGQLLAPLNQWAL